MGKLSSYSKELVSIFEILGIGIGISLFVLYELATAIGVNPAGNTINTIISGIGSAFTTLWAPAVLLLIVGIFYIAYKSWKGNGK